jgi:O-antigen/teichoic acid export membrane protein
MGLLLLLIGVLAAGDGALALWRGRRSGRGSATAVVVETVAGAAAIAASGVGLARVRPLAWGVVALVSAAVAVALVVRLRRALRDHDRREASEGARLKRYLESPPR